ncbi:MAG: DUF6120 family protein [Erysipelotrichaceae bacterium]|nr:DUF6120 family protein [Erysipelotrichaceae bacterium]
MKQAAKKYLNDCKHELVFTKSYDKNLYKNIVSQIEEYVSSHDGVTYEELCNKYGSPSDMAFHSLQSFEERDIIKKTNTYSLHKKFIIIVVLALFVFLGLGIKIYYDIQSMRIITEEITIE